MKTKKLAAEIIKRLRENGCNLSTAESCTGGGVGHVLTAIPGSSAAYVGGVISYTNAIKEAVLRVPESILKEHGAVSSQTALAMAQGVRSLMHTDFGVSVTGLAGPDSDGSGKPVGLVYVAASGTDREVVREFIFSGTRDAVRSQAVEAVLELLSSVIE